MNTEGYKLQVRDLAVEVVRKDIKNLHLGVYPPDGRVRVAAPVGTGDEVIRLAVIKRLSWIKRQREGFAGQERQSLREYISGESHYLFGQRYLLDVIPGGPGSRLRLRNTKKIELLTPRTSTREQRWRAFREWYRKELKAIVPPLIEKWSKTLEVSAPQWGIKRMRTKWGSCNAKAERIWLNLELAKKPIQGTEYVIVHEMAHLFERYHNDRFVAILDAALPQWRSIRDELNLAPLAHESWAV